MPQRSCPGYPLRAGLRTCCGLLAFAGAWWGASWIPAAGVRAANAAAPPARAPQARPGAASFESNGAFESGLTDWIPVADDPANSVTLDDTSRPAGGARFPVATDVGTPPRFMVRLSVHRTARPPNLTQRNGRLTAIAPATFHTLSFVARASSPRTVRAVLAQEYRPYRNLGLDATIPLDDSLRRYTVSFFTDSVIAPPHEPDASGPGLTFFADTIPGDTWVGDVALTTTAAVMQPPPGVTAARGAAPLRVSGEAWQGGGTWAALRTATGDRDWSLPLGPNQARFVWRDGPFAPGSGDWDLVLRLWIDAPENMGRVGVLARSSPAIRPDYVMASTSGFQHGWNVVRFPRRRFKQYWFSHFDWNATRTLAVRVETNANGPANLVLGDITVEPRPATPMPPQIRALDVIEVGPRSATVVVETDSSCVASLDYGATPAYGATLDDAARASVHRFRIDGLPPSSRVHARVRLQSRPGVGIASGDVAFTTIVTTPHAPAGAPVNAFDVGLYAVSTTADLEHAGRTAFDPFMSYQQISVALNTTADVRAYLDTAQRLGVHALVGFDLERVKARQLDYFTARVRALRDHPALRGWYLADEPELNGVDPDAMRAAYGAIHAADSAHPVMIAASRLGADYPYLGAFDIAILDRFPIPSKGPGAILPALELARAAGCGWAFVFQAFATDLDRHWPTVGPGPGRYPSADEMRVMAFLALNHGAGGIWAFAYSFLHDTPGSEWKWVELTELARELRGLVSVWGSREPPALRVTTSDPALDIATRGYAGGTYVVAVNPGTRPVRATLTFAGATAITADRVDAAATFDPTPGITRAELADVWAPYSVHVYRVTAGATGAPRRPRRSLRSHGVTGRRRRR